MTTHHSPGPWIFEHNGAGDSTTNCIDAIQKLDCEFRGRGCYIQSADHIGGITMEEYEANARLISAAPDLLEALESLVNYGNLGAYERADAMKAARAAISKATGGSQ